jgi:hypothetical protein
MSQMDLQSRVGCVHMGPLEGHRFAAVIDPEDEDVEFGTTEKQLPEAGDEGEHGAVAAADKREVDDRQGGVFTVHSKAGRSSSL